MQNNFTYSFIVATVMSCFSPVLYASENQDSYEELQQKFSALQSLEGRKITDGNYFFKEAAENLPVGRYVTIERPVLEHILLNTPSIVSLLVDNESELEQLLDLPFERIRMAYYAHRAEIEYEFIANYQVIHTDKDVNVAQQYMNGLVQTINAIGQKYFFKTAEILRHKAPFQNVQCSYEELQQKISALQSLEAKKITDGNAFFKEAAENLPAGRYVTIERPVLEHILLKAPSSVCLISSDASEFEKLLDLPFERIRMAYYAHRAEIEYEFIANHEVIVKATDDNINQQVMGQIVPVINSIGQKYFFRTSK